jgi:hypothetical protein
VLWFFFGAWLAGLGAWLAGWLGWAFGWFFAGWLVPVGHAMWLVYARLASQLR